MKIEPGASQTSATGRSRLKQARSESGGLELWGGHECTVNRVGDRFYDQTVRTGHERRLGDLQLFADAGFKALRYPVLWERISPERPDLADWRWSDERLNEIRRLGMRPIAGLVHHGSGPHYTNLLDDGFAGGLARHAAAVAQRYPWIDAWTPVNEPLTTARFSALYGHWYPHAHDESAFFTALLNQIDGVRLSMKAIRAVNPSARLIQTDDLGHTFATPPLQHQADFDNARRWLGWDLLTGRLSRNDEMYRRLDWHGLGDRMRTILDDPCPPDVIGVNYYLSSERFLDHRAERYPLHTRGSNFGQSFADVEAVRAVAPGPLGIERLIETTWERYGLPIAVTESHNGCTREEQMRWLSESWTAAQALRGRGVPVEAVTVWSLLGSCDWNRLLTVEGGHYEVGVWDVRTGEPRPTAMVDLCRNLARPEVRVGTEGEEAHPALAAPGWWSRDIRYAYEPVWLGGRPTPRRRWTHAAGEARPILITGATGRLGQAFAQACEHRGLPFVLTDRRELPLEQAAAVMTVLDRYDPWAVINAAGWSDIDAAEADADGCRLANVRAVETLVAACAKSNRRLLVFSSDQVFGDAPDEQRSEPAPIDPKGVYARSKAEAERAALVLPTALVIRSGPLFCPHEASGFAHEVTRSLSRAEMIWAAQDRFISPTFVAHLVEHALDLLIDGETGVRHLANDGVVSYAGFAKQLARTLGLDERLIRPVPATLLDWKADRAIHGGLASLHGQIMPPLQHGIDRYADAVRPTLPPAPARLPTPAERRRAASPVAVERRSFAAVRVASDQVEPKEA